MFKDSALRESILSRHVHETWGTKWSGKMVMQKLCIGLFTLTSLVLKLCAGLLLSLKYRADGENKGVWKFSLKFLDLKGHRQAQTFLVFVYQA